jgi:GT2 family glycosyltransferase
LPGGAGNSANEKRGKTIQNRLLSEGTPLITLIIINYNGRRFLPELFQGLEDQVLDDFQVILVDNDSSDESLSFVREASPETRILPLGYNAGFARAANLGVQKSESPYIGFLNTDLKIAPQWLEELFLVIKEDVSTGAVAPKMLLYDRPSILNGVGGCMNLLGYTWDRGMFEEDEGQFDEIEPVIFAPAAAALFSRKHFLEVGGFDERFFMYHEDVDLGWRLWLLGSQILTAPRAVVHHHFGGSTKENKGLIWREVLGERNNICSLIKNYETGTLISVLARLLLLKQPFPRKMAQLKSFLWNLQMLPETVKFRRFVQKRRVKSDKDLEHLIVQSQNVPISI